MERRDFLMTIPVAGMAAATSATAFATAGGGAVFSAAASAMGHSPISMPDVAGGNLGGLGYPGMKLQMRTYETLVADLAADGFAREVCQYLETARTRGAYDRLIVVAPPDFLGRLRKAITPAALGQAEDVPLKLGT